MAHPGRTAVYQFFARPRSHLYIGISNDPPRRFGEHAETKSWWPDVDHGLTKITWYSTRNQALRVEAGLIRRHRPPHNVQHHPGRRSRYAPERPTDSLADPALPALGVSALMLAGELKDFWDMPGWMTAGAVVAFIYGARQTWKLLTH